MSHASTVADPGLSDAPPAPRVSALCGSLVGSEILKIAAQIRQRVEQGARVCNLTVGDFAPSEFRIPPGLTRRIEAALVMIAVFAAFALGDFVLMKMLGFALAVAVLLDATVVRVALGPALLRLAGRWNWWPGERRGMFPAALERHPAAPEPPPTCPTPRPSPTQG